ncbi:MAG TPA: SRPBCC family protein [Luteitalea sp.]|nr:SRPBCC family protein [Luteitalea sp.]
MHTHADARSSHERLATGLGWFSLALGAAEIAAPRTLARLIGIPDDPRLLSVLRAFGAREIASGVGLLAQPGHPGWAWSRVGGDAIDLAFLGSAANEESSDRQRVALAALAVAGVAALDLFCARGLQDQAPSPELPRDADLHDVSVERSITVNRPIEEVYGFWKGYANLPRFMRHLESVETLGEQYTRWTAKGPAGLTLSWDAETIVDRENEWIAWRSLDNADVDNRGSVRFQQAPAGRGTEVRVHLQYSPPAGRLGRGLAWIFGEEPGQQIHEDLRRFKQLMETGEVPLSEGFGLWRPAQPAQDVDDLATLAGVAPDLVGTSARLEGGHA